MSAQKVSHCLPAVPVPFSSLPLLVLKKIVEFVGSGDVDRPETYGGSLLVMSEVFPVCLHLIQRWFEVRFVHTKSIDRLRYRLAVALPFSPALTPVHHQLQLIKTRLCRVCNTGTRGAFWMTEHYKYCHPREWVSLGQSLDHNRMPLPLPF